MRKNKKHQKPFHLHIEHHFRKQYVLLGVLALLVLALAKSDGKMLNGIRQAYEGGYGAIGAYLREETAHRHVGLEAPKNPTISGQ